MIPAIKLLRPKQWTKNFLVFAAFLFTGDLGSQTHVFQTLLAFATMCAASSTTYIANDIADVEKDRNHPTKRSRPIAAGQITVPAAILVACVLATFALSSAVILGPSVIALVLTYGAIQVAYNFGLKRVPVADVFAIAVGFVIRAVIGAAAIQVPISGWLLYCTAALALMLGFAKRRQEFIAQSKNLAATRESLLGYSRDALDALVIMFAGSAAVCYGVYSIQSKTAQRYQALIFTSFFVVYGIARYVLLVFSADEGGEPADVLFGDPQMIFAIVGFVVTAVIAVSGVPVPLLER
jgi:decaprenyl-phosphate phosphoribosyltransferase